MDEQFRRKNGTAGCAAHKVVRQADELVVVLRIRPQTADGDRHAALDHPVKLRLRAVRLFKVVQELLGCRRQLQF